MRGVIYVTGWTKTIAAMEAIGGVVGIITHLWVMFSSSNSVMFILCFFGLGAFVASFMAGLWLWQDDDLGYKWSLRVIAAQIPVLATPMIGYMFISGANFTLLLGAGFFFSAGIGSHCSLSIMQPAAGLVGVNFVALAAFLYLRRHIPDYVRLVQHPRRIDHTRHDV